VYSAWANYWRASYCAVEARASLLLNWSKMVFIRFQDLEAVLRRTLVSDSLTVSAFLESAEVSQLLEGQADNGGLELRDDQINSLPGIWRQGVGETGSFRTILSRFSFHDRTLTFQAGRVQPQGVVRKPHFL